MFSNLHFNSKKDPRKHAIKSINLESTVKQNRQNRLHRCLAYLCFSANRANSCIIFGWLSVLYDKIIIIWKSKIYVTLLFCCQKWYHSVSVGLGIKMHSCSLSFFFPWHSTLVGDTLTLFYVAHIKHLHAWAIINLNTLY